MSHEEVHALAVEVVRGNQWVAWTPDALESAFGAILALAAPIPPNIQTCVASIDARFPMACNGYPMFTEARFLTGNDLVALHAEVARLSELLESS